MYEFDAYAKIIHSFREAAPTGYAAGANNSKNAVTILGLKALPLSARMILRAASEEIAL